MTSSCHLIGQETRATFSSCERKNVSPGQVPCVSELLVNILNLNKVEVKKTLCIYTLNELVSADEDDTTLLR